MKCALARTIHVSYSHTKLGWISSNGLEGDSMMDRWMDGWTDGWRMEAKTISPSLEKKPLGL